MDMASSGLLRRSHVIWNVTIDNPHRLPDCQEAFVPSSKYHDSKPFPAKIKVPAQRGRDVQAGVQWVAQRSSLQPHSDRSWGRAVGANVPHVTSIPAQAQLQAAVPLTTGLAVGKFAVQGPREEMEDELVVVTDGPRGFLYAGVFDGHAGTAAAHFLREELYAECVTALGEGSLLESNDTSEAEAAVVHAFVETDKRLLAWLQEGERQKESGSTATVMFLREDRLLVAHAGDSRAVLCRSGKAEDITEDHRPYGRSKKSMEELKRITKAGGWVTHGRVCGTLSVSRAFGDSLLKTQKKDLVERGVTNRLWTNDFAANLDYSGDWITAMPDVWNNEITQDVEFVVVATDGLWDAVTSSEVVRFARRHLKKHGNVQSTCEALVQRALDKNGQDNIAIVIVDFGRRSVEDNSSWWSRFWEYVATLLDIY